MPQSNVINLSKLMVMTLYLFGKIYNIVDNLSMHWIERWFAWAKRKCYVIVVRFMKESSFDKYFWSVKCNMWKELAKIQTKANRKFVKMKF